MNGEHYRPLEAMCEVCDLLNRAIDARMEEMYKRGYADGLEDGKEQSDRDGTKRYLKGLNDAWAAAKKLMDMPSQDRDRVFDSQVYYDIIRDRTPSTVITMLERYEKDKEIAEKEEKRQQTLDHDFAIGNIVRHKSSINSPTLLIVSRYEEDGEEYFDAIDRDGCKRTAYICSDYVWTGIHSGVMNLLNPKPESEEES